MLFFLKFNSVELFNIVDYIADYDFDIFAVTETWLLGDDYDQYYIRDICPDGYKFYHIPRIHSTGGRVGVVLKDSFSVETIRCGHYGSFESIELTLKISGFFVRLRACLYGGEPAR